MSYEPVMSKMTASQSLLILHRMRQQEDEISSLRAQLAAMTAERDEFKEEAERLRADVPRFERQAERLTIEANTWITYAEKGVARLTAERDRARTELAESPDCEGCEHDRPAIMEENAELRSMLAAMTAERDAAYRQGQDEMREAVIKKVGHFAICQANESSRNALYRAADAIRALPIKAGR